MAAVLRNELGRDKIDAGWSEGAVRDDSDTKSWMGVWEAAALIVIVATAFLLARQYRESLNVDEPLEPLSLALEREAAEVNATLPEMVSEGVRLDKATAGPGNAFNYNYTIVDDEAAKTLIGNAKKLAELKTQLQERVCLTMPNHRSSGAIIRYSLKDNKGEMIADVSIDAGDC
ncbi:hypothetical protein [Methylocystis suflitae]|uniref:hypothetical protein n=1 Tax=Methylocystis suflitae TaxID=2951405 RepID=UPI00210B5394|nr:hypothetical protein [Methylocystis suflitae]MCQ4191568.1 hypothetical protein [Methylocystis suflitae]